MKSGAERVLLEKNLMPVEEVKRLRKLAADGKKSFLKVLLAEGKITEEEMQDLLSQRFKVPKLDLDRFEVKKEALGSLNPQVCRKYQVMPIAKAGGRKLILAMADPGDPFVIEDLSAVAQMRLEVVVATESAIERAINKYYVPTGDIDSFMNMMGEGGEATIAESDIIDADEDPDSEHSGTDSAIIKFVNKMLADAIYSGASDIHVEPYEKRVRIRYRVDGALVEKLEPPQGAASAIVSRIKIMSRLDIAERRRPQDGRLKVRMSQGKEIDFRVSVIPCLFGEKVVMRVLDSSGLNVDIATLGFHEDDLGVIKDIISRPQGMVLVTGPTGSGKTTTLYSFLDAMNRADVNISTAEDPVEYNLDGINQVQVHPDIGFDFASTLRSFLRQDPDIIMVGEIRDLETAQIAFKAASTGHLVLSTLHTNDSVGTVTRLVDMGIPSYVVSETVSLVIAQRLMKRICKFCIEPAQVPEKDLKMLGVSEDDLHLYQNLKRGKGCHQCNRTGYKGRIPVFEILQMTNEVRKSILNGDSPVDMKKRAVAEGTFHTLRMSALTRLRDGVSTVEEVLNCSVRDDEE
ncbi:MAG: type IV-A pilus assembly ATPase PilB [Bdellovibrionaceae bacterium]|nr:type IV-A pilus assembly ATPase PilB [Pseudobdellovibrionaceae bacterium]